MAFENFLDPVFGPLLNLPPLLSVTILSLLISLIIIIIYKYTTNQKLMKQLKDDLKSHQDEMKKNKDNPDKMLSIQKQAMDSNMKYMMQSMKSTLFTFIPIIIIFGWIGAHYAYMPIAPEEQFNIVLAFEKNTMGNITITVPSGIDLISDKTQKVNDTVIYALKGVEGNYVGNNTIWFEYGGRKFHKDVIITSGHLYAPKDELIKSSNLKGISIGYKKLIVLPVINWGWLGTYIVLSLVFSMVLRKLFKVY